MAIRHRIGPLSEIPEDEGLRLEVGGHAVAVFREGSKVVAVGDSCPHMGASLSEGYMEAGSVVCPWHGWVFDAETGVSPFDDDACIPVYRVGMDGEDLYVEVDSDAVDECPSRASGEGGG